MGASEWTRREKEFDNPEELDAFAARKVNESDEYDEALEKMEEMEALVGNADLTKEEFIAKALIRLGGVL